MKVLLSLSVAVSFLLFVFNYPPIKSLSYTWFLHEIVYKHSVPLLLVDELPNEKYLILDTRSKREYEVGHLPKALHVGFETFALNKLQGTKKDTPILVYCSIGYRSERVGELLQKVGYNNVHNLDGGIFEYVNQGNALSGINEKSIHPYSIWWGVWLSAGQKHY